MPARISAGVGDHPCFLTFITMVPIDIKSNNFPYACLSFFFFLRLPYFLAGAQ